MINRETRDLDCFGPWIEAVDELAPAAIAALRDPGFEVASEQVHTGFVRLRVSPTGEESLVDLGFDPATLPPTQTDLGPVRALGDLAGDKLLALFSRAAPWDFVDIAGLLGRFSHNELIELAAAKDRGFDGSYSLRPSACCQRSDGTDSTSTNPATKRYDASSKTGAPTSFNDALSQKGALIIPIDSYSCSAAAGGKASERVAAISACPLQAR